MSTPFETLRRQQFRRYFQPSRVLLCVVPAPNHSKVNVITLSFSMHCSYKPPMLAVAINDQSSTFNLIQSTDQYVLSVPGANLVDASMYCGIHSMKDTDKVEALSLDLIKSECIATPGLLAAIANIEMRKHSQIKAGDHLIVIGEAVRFAVNKNSNESPLVSVGPYTNGYRVLRKKGIHRLAIVQPE